MSKEDRIEEPPPLTVEDQINAAWEASGANILVTEAESEAAREALTEFDLMPTHELEMIVGVDGNKGSAEYEGAQKALLRRPEYRPGQTGGQFYQGNHAPRPGKSGGR